MLPIVCLWLVPEIALAVPPGLRLELLTEGSEWSSGRIELEGQAEVTVGIHASGEALHLGNAVFLDPASDDPGVVELAETRVFYPLAAAAPALEAIARQGRQLTSARLQPTRVVSVMTGEPDAHPPWLLASWSFEEDLGRPGVTGSIAGRVALPPEHRMAQPERLDGRPRERGGDLYIGPFDKNRDFDGGLADAILLLDALEPLDARSAGYLRLANASRSGTFALFGATRGIRREPEGIEFYCGAYVHDDRPRVVAFETAGEVSAGGFSAMLAWAAEREREGELLAGLAPISQPGEPDRALAVMVRAERFWDAAEGRLYELGIDSGQVRVERVVHLEAGMPQSGDRILGWKASSADGWLYLWGSRRSVWTCTFDDQPPFPWVEYGGAKHKLVAGRALEWR